MEKLKFYVCPICGNVLLSAGEAVVSCCGLVLPPLEAEEADAQHRPDVSVVEDEYYVTVAHEMSRTHSLSFFAAVRDNGVEVVKLYPEGNAECRFKIDRTKDLYCYCSRHGLFRMNPRKI